MVQSRFGGALGPISRLFSGGTVAGLSDASLLGRFVSDRDEDAFAALVTRHGPLVWGVCRDVLRDPADVEDAFQATFLILVRRARSLWVDDSLGGWLYRVAHRVAVRANIEGRRRCAREHSGANLDAVAEPNGANGQRAELHEAIAAARTISPGGGALRAGGDDPGRSRAGLRAVRRRCGGGWPQRERLRVRLAEHGNVGALLAGARASNAGAAPFEWGQRIPTAAAKVLAREVSAIMMHTLYLKLAALVLAMGLATAATATYLFTPGPTDEPAGAASAARRLGASDVRRPR